MRASRLSKSFAIGISLALAFTLAPWATTASADARQPITGIFTLEGDPLPNAIYTYDNVDCTAKNDLGEPLDITEPERAGIDTTDSDGSYSINARPGECYTVSLEADGWAPTKLITYNGVTGGFALLAAGQTNVVIEQLGGPTKPLRVTLSGAKKGSLAQLILKRPDGYWEEVSESAVGGWSSNNKQLGWSVTTETSFDESILFWVNPELTYTVSFSGDDTHYPQFIDGVDAIIADYDDAALITATPSNSPQEVNYTLKAGSAASGHVKYSGNTPSEATATAYRLVTIWYEEDDSDVDTIPVLNTAVDANGNYSLSPLVPGEKYLVCVAAPTYAEKCLGDEGEESYIDDDDNETEWAPTDPSTYAFTAPAAGLSTTVDEIELNRRTGAIQGKAINLASPLHDSEIYAIDITDGSDYFSTKISGGFRIDDLPTGVYLLVGRGLDRNGDIDRGVEKLVTVTEGEIAYQDLTAIRRSENGHPWAGDLGNTDVKITGDFELGDTLTATATTTRNNTAPNYSYYWTDGEKIIGEGPTLTLTGAMGHKQISVFVLVNGEKAFPAWAIGWADDEVHLLEELDPIIEPYFVSGANPKIGQKTLANPGSWEPEPDNISYQWLLDDLAIPGATEPSFTPRLGDAWSELTLQLTLRREGHEKTVYYLDSVSPVDGQVKISGTAKVGKTLKAVTPEPADFKTTYQWLRNGDPIDGAESHTYKVKKADAGKKISLEMTVSKDEYTEVSATSNVKKIPKFKSSIKVTRANSAPATYQVKVNVKGNSATGKLKVKFGSWSKTYTLKAAAKGKKTVKLPPLGRGTYQIKFTYKGTSHNKKVSKKVKLVIR